MSLRPDGAYRCDSCDADVGNGSVIAAAIVTDSPDMGLTHRQYHLCRQPRPKRPRGCAGHVLGPAVLAAYRKAFP